MVFVFGVLVVLFTFILGILFWPVAKAEYMVKSTLRNPEALKELISNLLVEGFFEKNVDEVDESGCTWNAVLARWGGYEELLNAEYNSSIASFNTPLTVIVLLLAPMVLFEFFYLPAIYFTISLLLFLVLALLPLNDAGKKRAQHELSAWCWLMFQWNKMRPEECKQFYKKTDVFKNLSDAVTQTFGYSGAKAQEAAGLR
jgi:hypothetical protein